MDMRKENKPTWKAPIIAFRVFFFLILFLYLQLAYLALSKTVYGKDLDQFALTRNTVKKTISATRGTIYDANQKILAINVSSYTVIAYLDPKRSQGSNKPLHVEDPNTTAEKLAPILNMDVAYLTKLLTTEKAYQVELGPGGRGITELKKDEIVALELPGIDFVEGTKRNYPNGDFASYIVGYARENEVTKEENGVTSTSTQITGELGIESKYNEQLQGVDGYLEYQQDKNGYKIPGTKEISVKAQNGLDIYLTIDSSIQRFLEAQVKEKSATYNPEWMFLMAMDAKTGDILGSASTPSYDPNIRNIKNYENPLVSYVFEPGSTMKTFTYMCAIDKGNYDGNATFQSGSMNINGQVVSDWNKFGFGTINYDKGYEYSSNIGAVNIVQNYLSRKELYTCLKKYGFGETTGLELPREQAGTLNFVYPVEVATASFGQGITITPVQMMQALTLISNDGKMLKPHVILKTVDPNTGEVVYQRKVEESEQLIKNTTVSKIKELMYNVVHGTDANNTGNNYKIEGYDIIGKTGTAEIYDAKHGGYLTGENNYIFSFSGMYPKDNPQIIIYGAIKRPATLKSRGVSLAVKSVIESIAKYKNMFKEKDEAAQIPDYVVGSYTNKTVSDIVKNFSENGIQSLQIGKGTKIIDQYPSVGTILVPGDTVILKTNDSNYQIPSLIGLSRELAVAYLSLLGQPFTEDGYGFVVSQSLPQGSAIDPNNPIGLKLESKIKEHVE